MRTLLRLLTSLVRRKKTAAPNRAEALAFWRRECRRMTRNVCATLRLAKESVTRENVIAFIASMPLSLADFDCRKSRRKYWYHCVKKAHERTKGTKRRKQFDALFTYFQSYFMSRDHFHQQCPLSNLFGVLDGLSLDGTPGLYQLLTRTHGRPAKN
jgi:hypothetical protein